MSKSILTIGTLLGTKSQNTNNNNSNNNQHKQSGKDIKLLNGVNGVNYSIKKWGGCIAELHFHYLPSGLI